MAVHRVLVTAVLVRTVAAVKVVSDQRPPPPSTAAPTAAPTPEPTPQPTHSELLPGLPCPCLPPTCFQTYDLDNDTCLEEHECQLQQPLMDNCFGNATYGPAVWDPDRDGCINLTEWLDVFAATNGTVCPLAPPEIPDECPRGYYLVFNPTECETCWNGFTRRRRSIECTPCPNGFRDLGDYDDCVDTHTRTITIDLPNGTVDIPTIDPPSLFCDSIEIGDVMVIRGQDPDCQSEVDSECLLTFDCTVLLTDVPVGFSNLGQTMILCAEGILYPMPAHSEIHHRCDVTDGTDVSSKHSEVSGGCVCACGDTLCGELERCTVFPNGTGVCSNPQWPEHSTPAPTVGARGDPHLVNLQGEHFDINHEGDFMLLRIPQAAERPAEFSFQATILPDAGKPCTTYITEVELSGAWLGNTSVGIRSYRRSHSFAPDVFLGVQLRRGETKSRWQPLEDFQSEDLVLSGSASPVEATLSKAAWFPKKRSTDGPSTAGMFTLSLRSGHSPQRAQITIRQDLPEQEHLNVAMRQLSHLGRVDVGGLLGFDPHPESLERPSAACHHHRASARYHVESQEDNGYYFRPTWQDKWDQIRRGRHRPASDEEDDNEAAASLVSRAAGSAAHRGAMCKCPSEGSQSIEGVIVDEASFMFAEAAWE